MHVFIHISDRSSWRVISSIEQKTESSARKQQLAREYRERVEKELREICYEVLVSIQNIQPLINFDYVLIRHIHSHSHDCFYSMFYRVSWTNTWFQKPVIQRARYSTWRWRVITTGIWLRLPQEKHETVSIQFDQAYTLLRRWFYFVLDQTQGICDKFIFQTSSWDCIARRCREYDFPKQNHKLIYETKTSN